MKLQFVGISVQPTGWKTEWLDEDGEAISAVQTAHNTYKLLLSRCATLQPIAGEDLDAQRETAFVLGAMQAVITDPQGV